MLRAVQSIKGFLVICGLGLVSSLFAGGAVYGQAAEATRFFDEGNQFYRAGEYEEAIQAYEKAIALGYTSGALNYNLGNAYYRSDNLGQAIRYYEKARVFLPDNPELLHNLEIARSQTEDQISRLPIPAWLAWWQGLVARNRAWALFLTGFLVYGLAIGLFIHRIRTHTQNPWHRRARSLSLLVALLLFAASFAASLQSERLGQAVIVADEVELREGPAETSEPVMSIHEGLVVDLMNQDANWVEIRLPNGTRGWVSQAAIADV